MPLRPLRLLWGGLACAATVAAVAYCWTDEQKNKSNSDDQPSQSAPSASDAPSDAAASASASADDTAAGAASAPLQSVTPHSNPSLLCSACRALLTPSDIAASMTASADPCAAASAAAAAAAPVALDAPIPAGTDVPAGAMGASCTMSPTAPAHSEDKAAVAKSCGEAESASASASASAAEPLSAAVAAAAAPSSALPACLDPLLELFRQRSLPLPRIRMLAAPESDLPEPYFGLLHHSLNMTPTLSRFWMDQEVRLRVLCKQEHRQSTEADPHGTLARWITLQVDQPVHVGCSAEVKERFLQQQQQRQSTHTGTDGSSATPATLATSTSATSAAPSTPAPVARSSTSTSASSSGRKSAAKPGRFYYADSVQQAESSAAISTPMSASPCASSGNDVDTMRAVCDAAVAAHERALLGATAVAEAESCATALLPPQHASAVLAAKTAMDEAVAAYEAALMLAHEHADSPVASASASATAPSAAAPSSTPSPSPSPPPPTLSSPRLVEFGSIRIRLSNLPPSLREHIWAGQVPFATLLLQHRPEPIRQIIRPQAFFAIEWDRTLTDLIGLTQQGSDDAQGSGETLSPPVVVYGRCNYIFSGEDKLICEVVEIMPPIQDMQITQEDGDSAAQ